MERKTSFGPEYVVHLVWYFSRLHEGGKNNGSVAWTDEHWIGVSCYVATILVLHQRNTFWWADFRSDLNSKIVYLAIAIMRH